MTITIDQLKQTLKRVNLGENKDSLIDALGKDLKGIDLDEALPLAATGSKYGNLFTGQAISELENLGVANFSANVNTARAANAPAIPNNETPKSQSSGWNMPKGVTDVIAPVREWMGLQDNSKGNVITILGSIVALFMVGKSFDKPSLGGIFQSLAVLGVVALVAGAIGGKTGVFESHGQGHGARRDDANYI